MEGARKIGERMPAHSGKRPEGMARLLVVIETARRLEEAVFRDWPSFAEPMPMVTGSLPVEESLAEALGATAEEARQKMDARRLELNSMKG